MTHTEPIVSAAINLALDVATAEVTAAFRAEGIPTILLKGAALRDWPSPDPARRSGDVDLLVPPDRFDDAERVLERLGFESRALDGLPYDRPVPAHSWAGGPYGTRIDLHRTLIGVRASPELLWDVLASETEEIDLGSCRVTVLAPAARAMHVALHAAQHGKNEAQPLDDLRRAVSALPLKLWRDASVTAERLHAVEAFAAGLRLLPGGQVVARALELPRTTNVDVTLLAAGAPQMAAGLAWLDELPGIYPRARLIAGKLLPPPEWLRNWSPLARRGRVGLVVAYVWRPVWLAIHTPPALLAWGRARKAARASNRQEHM